MANERSHAAALLRMAEADRDALRGMIASATPGLFSDEIFGFHCQQAAEKALKAWITLAGEEYAKTHDLRSLLTVLTAAGIDVSEWEWLVELNAFAVMFRYEAITAEEEEDPVDRKPLLDGVERLVDVVRRSVAARDSAADESE